jgi:hypothetical protein
MGAAESSIEVEPGPADAEIAAGFADISCHGRAFKKAQLALDLAAILFHPNHPFLFRASRRVSRKFLPFYMAHYQLA